MKPLLSCHRKQKLPSCAFLCAIGGCCIILYILLYCISLKYFRLPYDQIGYPRTGFEHFCCSFVTCYNLFLFNNSVNHTVATKRDINYMVFDMLAPPMSKVLSIVDLVTQFSNLLLGLYTFRKWRLHTLQS